MKNIVIDLDNTLNNLIHFLHSCAVKKQKDIPHYSNWDSYFTLNKYFDDKEVEEIIDKAIAEHDSSYAPPIENIDKLCNFFKENEIMVKIVTLRDERFAKITEDWLNFHKSITICLFLQKINATMSIKTLFYILTMPRT